MQKFYYVQITREEFLQVPQQATVVQVSDGSIISCLNPVKRNNNSILLVVKKDSGLALKAANIPSILKKEMLLILHTGRFLR